jgi:chromosome condensin MukBEF ATPase and DNA-binding subunit MukB
MLPQVTAQAVMQGAAVAQALDFLQRIDAAMYGNVSEVALNNLREILLPDNV